MEKVIKTQSTLTGFKWATLQAVFQIFFKVIRASVIPKLLSSAAEYGLFSSIGFFTRYLQFSDLGSKAYFSKSFPHYHYHESKDASNELISRTLSFLILTSLLPATYLIYLSIFYKGEFEAFYKMSFLLLIPNSALFSFREFYIIYANAIQDYKISQILRISYDITSLVVIIAGIYFFGAIGGIWGTLLTEMIVLVMCIYFIRIPLKIRFSKQIFFDIKDYIKQFVVSMIEVFGASVDQIFILMLLSKADFGLYSFTLTLHWVMIAIASIFRSTLVPKMMAFRQKYADKIQILYKDVAMLFILACFAILPILALAFDLFVKLYLISFKQGLRFYFLSIFSGILRAAITVLKDFYIAKNMEKNYVSRMLLNNFIIVLMYMICRFYAVELYHFVYAIILCDLIVFLIIFNGFNFANQLRVNSEMLFYLFLCFLASWYFSEFISPISDISSRYVYNNIMNIFVFGFLSFFFVFRKRQIIRNVINL